MRQRLRRGALPHLIVLLKKRGIFVNYDKNITIWNYSLTLWNLICILNKVKVKESCNA